MKKLSKAKSRSQSGANLKINVSDLIGKSPGISGTVEISQNIPSPDPDNLKNEPEILGKVTFTKLESSILGSFDLKSQVALLCSRCSKEFKLPIHLKYEQEFSYADTKQKNPDLLYTISENNLDILPSINQETLLAIPLKPLCKKSCQGLKIQ